MKKKTGLWILALVVLMAAGCQPTVTDQEIEATAAEGSEVAAEEAGEQEAMPEETPPAAPPSAAQPAPGSPSSSAASQPQSPPATPPAMPPPVAAEAPAEVVAPGIEIPEGTVIQLELRTDLSSKDNVVGDRFKSRVLEPVTMGGQVIIPERSKIHGSVTEAISAQKMKGQAQLSLAFDTLELPDGTTYELSAVLTEEGVKVGKRTGAIIGGSAAGGALLGKIIGKDTKGAVKGAVIGAVIGTGIAAAQKGQDLELPKGTGMAVVLEAPLQLPVP